MNFNEIFRKDVTFDNVKNHKKTGLYSLSRRNIFGKTTGRKVVNLAPPSCLRVNTFSVSFLPILVTTSP